MKRRTFLSGGLSALGFVSARALGDKAPRAIRGDLFAHDGREIVLSDIIAPRLNGPGGPEAGATASKEALQAILETPYTINDVASPDRWERRIARVDGGRGGTTVQEALVSTGMARVRPQSDDHAFIAHLLRIEEDARRAGRGVWALKPYSVLHADAAERGLGGFHLVEGAPLRADKGRSRFYLNFGDDYRRDFTASAKSRLGRRWRSRGWIDLETLAGARLRLRGHIAWINGPSIDLAHPLQIERLS